MHPNPAFRTADDVTNITFARDRGFGMLALNAPDGPLLSHVPFALSDDGTTVALHLVRSNPILRLLATPQQAVIAVTGPDGYISPDWYETEDQVPTWNYIAVHLRGTLAQLPETDLPAQLDHQSAQFENRLLPKTPWTTTKMTPEVHARMMRQIVPCRLTVTAITGTWKLNQNKTDAARLRAADKVEISTLGSDTQSLAHLMRHKGPVP